MSMLLGKLSEMDLDLGEVRLREVKAEQNLFKGGEDRSGVGSTEGIRRGREVYSADFARRLSTWELSRMFGIRVGFGKINVTSCG